MASATKYVDNVNGNNGNTGNSEAQAYADLATALAACSGGGNTIHMQAAGSNYTITTAHAISFAGDVTNGRNVIEGYTTVPGARDGRPTITCATNSVHLFTNTSTPAYWTFAHINLTHTATGTRGNAFNGGSTTANRWLIDDCIIDGCNIGISDGFGMTDLVVRGCWIKNCVSHGISTGNGGNLTLEGNVIASNGGSGLVVSFGTNPDVLSLVGNVFRSNTARGVLVSATTVPQLRLRGNQFRANGTDGFAQTSANAPTVIQHENNYYHLNGAYGISLGTAALNAYLAAIQSNDYNFFGSGGQINTLGARNIMPVGSHDGSFSGDPNISSTVAALNSTASAGAVLRAAAYPQLFPGGSVGYGDVGPLQHQDAGGTPTAQNRGLATGGRL